MLIKYVGEKPTITQHGITFNHAKEDKYIYLKGAIHILHLIDPKHEKEFDDNISDQEITNMLQEYEPDIEKKIPLEEASYKEKLKHELDNVEHNEHLKEIEKEVWKKNIKLMQPYRIQRSVNKIYYEHAIRAIKRIIEEEKISKIILPLDKTYFHLVNSIKNRLELGKKYHDSEVKMEMNHELMVLEFTIDYNYN